MLLPSTAMPLQFNKIDRAYSKIVGRLNDAYTKASPDPPKAIVAQSLKIATPVKIATPALARPVVPVKLKPERLDKLEPEEFERRYSILRSRLRDSLGARFITDRDIRKTYINHGIYALIRSAHMKVPKMVALIDHESDLKAIEALEAPERKYLKILIKCRSLQIRVSI